MGSRELDFMNTPMHAIDLNETVASMDQPERVATDQRRQKDRDKMAQRRARRATYDLPPSIRQEMQSLSEALRIPASQLASLALARFLKEYQAGSVDLSLYKKPSRSPRYDWNLELPETLIKIKKSNRSLK
jgi:hypothetical protein